MPVLVYNVISFFFFLAWSFVLFLQDLAKDLHSGLSIGYHEVKAHFSGSVLRNSALNRSLLSHNFWKPGVLTVKFQYHKIRQTKLQLLKDSCAFTHKSVHLPSFISFHRSQRLPSPALELPGLRLTLAVKALLRMGCIQVLWSLAPTCFWKPVSGLHPVTRLPPAKYASSSRMTSPDTLIRPNPSRWAMVNKYSQSVRSY